MIFLPQPNFDPKPYKQCTCPGPCTGYDSCADCPPLIVLAVLASELTAAPAKTT